MTIPLTADNYQLQTVSNSFIIKRWLHQKRFRDALELLNFNKNDLFLDYGCGDGTLMNLASFVLPASQIFGFEPSSKMFFESVTNTKQKLFLSKYHQYLPGQKFTKIAFLETGEHLTETKLREALTTIKHMAANNASILISVPIETGIPGFAKNIYRLLKGHKLDNLTPTNVAKTLFGLPIQREPEKKLGDIDYIYSHVGFNHRKFSEVLRKYFAVVQIFYSPVNILGGWLNNTVYYRLGK